MVRNLVFIIMVYLFVHTAPLFSQESAGVITKIELIGLRRTRPNIARQPLEKFIGQESSAFDPNEVFATVQEMRVLNPISAELIEMGDDITLRVTVAEKWSTFPFPMVMANSGETSFGLFLMDSNAFGQRDMLVLGGAYGTYGWSAMAMYNHNPRRGGLPGWNTFFRYGRHDREDVDRDESVYRKYSTNLLRASLGLHYPFSTILRGSIALSFSDISLINDDGSLNPPLHGAMHLGLSPRISVRQSSWDGIFLSQRSFSLGYSYNAAIAGSSFHQAEFQGIYEHSLVSGFRLFMRSGGVWNSVSDPLHEEGPQKAQVSILPRNFSALRYAGFSTGLEKHLFKAPWGTLAVLGSWQGVFSYGPISGSEFNHGPSGGMLFYLNRIALPAIGGNLSYNMNSGLLQFGFSIGMSF